VSEKKEAKKLAREAERQGFIVKTTSRGHWQFFTADGDFITDLAGTPSSSRAVTNTAAALRRHGFRWKGW
jgi:hypothetical protein